MLSFARKKSPHPLFVSKRMRNAFHSVTPVRFGRVELGICHVPDQPPRTIGGATGTSSGRTIRYDGLVRAGRIALVDLVYGAVKAQGSPDVSAPSGPDFHQFAKREIAEKLLSEAGFANVDFAIVDCAWDPRNARRPVRNLREGNGPSGHAAWYQPAANLAAIRATITDTVRERFAMATGGASRFRRLCWPPPRPGNLKTVLSALA